MTRLPFFKRPARPHGYRWSEMVLGRRRVCEQFKKIGEVTVSVYEHKGKMRYTDPVTTGSKAGPRVLYRIHVKAKLLGVST